MRLARWTCYSLIGLAAWAGIRYWPKSKRRSFPYDRCVF